VRARLASSAHYLRYFIFAGYVTFLLQVPSLLSHPVTQAALPALGSGLSAMCIVMDARNYMKYRRLTDPGPYGPPFGIVTVVLVVFYIACGWWFLTQIPPG
jgi:hypothetical protein